MACQAAFVMSFKGKYNNYGSTEEGRTDGPIKDRLKSMERRRLRKELLEEIRTLRSPAYRIQRVEQGPENPAFTSDFRPL